AATPSAGYRQFTFTYKGPDAAERSKTVHMWYPTTKEADRHKYGFQVGVVAPEAPVLDKKCPLVLFSHGFLGSADQTIFLMEALARKGYVVAGVNHADSLQAPKGKGKPVGLPNFVDAKSWNDTKFKDRKEDMTALLDHLLELD